jgi:transcriptional regulator with XRE-family HTH domain
MSNNIKIVLSPPQCRAARALLGWSQDDLENASEVAKKTIADFERGARSPYARTLTDLQRALETAGIEFIAENGGGPGVRLRKVGGA